MLSTRQRDIQAAADHRLRQPGVSQVGAPSGIQRGSMDRPVFAHGRMNMGESALPETARKAKRFFSQCHFLSVLTLMEPLFLGGNLAFSQAVFPWSSNDAMRIL